MWLLYRKLKKSRNCHLDLDFNSSYTIRLPLKMAYFGVCLAASLQLTSSPSFLLPAAESSSIACMVGDRSVYTESKAVPSLFSDCDHRWARIRLCLCSGYHGSFFSLLWNLNETILQLNLALILCIDSPLIVSRILWRLAQLPQGRQGRRG